MSENNIESNNQSFKVIIIVLTITLLGSLFYIYKISDRTKGIIMSLREEKAEVLKDLEKSKLFLDQALNNESSVNSQLILEQEKVKKLIDEIKKEGVNKTEIVQIKKGADNVNERINALVKELNFYKKKADSTTVILGKQKVLNDTLVNSNKILSKKITTASKLYYYGLQVVAYKLRSSGEKVATEKARKTDLLKISFAIAENDLVKAFNNTLYVQIIDSNNNVIGEKKTENFGNDILIYSYTANVKYKNKTIKIEQELPVEYIEKGPYFINVFDKSNLVLHTSITLL
jgi:predicted Holliday junction resolvase-like endonuclease